jgi:tetratricopeptide (TPR) repeat protein
MRKKYNICSGAHRAPAEQKNKPVQELISQRAARPVGRHFCLALVCMGLFCMLSCTSTVGNGPSDADELSRANYLIDKQQYSEAIYVLESRLSRSSDDNRARVLLASAYAARAGVRIANYTAFAHEIEKWKAIDDLLPTSDDDQWTQAVAKVTFRLQVAIRAFESLPNVSGESALKDIHSAVKTLDEGGRIQGGSSLFRALLRVVDFKNRIYSEDRPQVFARCQIRTEDLSQWLENVATEVKKIIEDVGYGLKDQGSREQTLQIANNLNESLKKIAQYQLQVATVELPEQIEVPPFLVQIYHGFGGRCR